MTAMIAAGSESTTIDWVDSSAMPGRLPRLVTENVWPLGALKMSNIHTLGAAHPHPGRQRLVHVAEHRPARRAGGDPFEQTGRAELEPAGPPAAGHLRPARRPMAAHTVPPGNAR